MNYPVLNPNHPLASGMVGAWFPGYGGGNCPDATGTWLPVTTQTFCAAGPLVGNSFGPAMSFDGLTQGLYATGAGMPLSGVAQFTLACVMDQAAAGWPSGFGMGICVATLNDPNAARYNLDFEWTSPTSIDLRQNANGLSNHGPTQTLPVPVTVGVGAFDLTGGLASLYVNGGSAITRAIATGASAFDSVGIGLRPQPYPASAGCSLTSGSNIVTAAVGNTLETIIIGAPITDTAGVVPAGTTCTNFDNVRTVTMSANATGNSASDTLTFGPPLARLKNGTINLGVMWNRLLSPSEIASFAGSPMAPFNLGAGPIGGGVPSGAIFRLKTPAWR